MYLVLGQTVKRPAPHQCVQKVRPEAEGTLYLVPAGTSAGYIRRYSPASVNVFGGNVPGQPRPLVFFGEIVVVLTPNNCFGAVKESLGVTTIQSLARRHYNVPDPWTLPLGAYT